MSLVIEAQPPDGLNRFRLYRHTLSFCGRTLLFHACEGGCEVLLQRVYWPQVFKHSSRDQY
jgi:hypothetical protein